MVFNITKTYRVLQHMTKYMTYVNVKGTGLLTTLLIHGRQDKLERKMPAGYIM